MNRQKAEAAELAHPLRKPVNTLAIVPTRSSKITVLARKAYNVLLYIAQEQGIEQEVYRAPLQSILRGVDFNSHAREIVKQHLRSMVSTTVEWQSPTAGEGEAWNVAGLLAHAKVFKQGGENWVEWSFAPSIKQELLEPQRFARLRLEVISQLRRHSGVVLYEICARYRDIGLTARQPWSWWRPVLTGSPDTEASVKQEYRFFKRDVLKLAIAEVNAATELDVELIEHKAGRFIADIQFRVSKKRQESLALRHPPTPVDLSQVVRATAAGLRVEEAETLLQQYGADPVAAGLDALQKRVASGFPEPLRDPHRYLRALLEAGAASQNPKSDANANANANANASATASAAAIAHDPGAPASSASAPDARGPAALRSAPPVTAPPRPLAAAPAPGAAPRAAPSAPLSSGAALEGWTAEWVSARRARVVAEFDALPPPTQADWLERLRVDLVARGVHPSIRKRLQTNGWKHPMVSGELIRFFAGPDWDKPTAEELLAVAAQPRSAR